MLKSLQFKDQLFQRGGILVNAKFERGQGLVEYALILVFVAIVVIAVVTVFGPLIGNNFTTVNSVMP